MADEVKATEVKAAVVKPVTFEYAAYTNVLVGIVTKENPEGYKVTFERTRYGDAWLPPRYKTADPVEIEVLSRNPNVTVL